MRISDTLRKNKKNLIIYAILWLILVIVFIMPISAGMAEATINESLNLGDGIELGIKYIKEPFSTFGIVFTQEYFSTFKSILLGFSIIWLFFIIYGTMRNESKGEYENIEHGSSDWSKGGEQYKILSNKKGIILAEDHYLPVDKRGNVNVLVVGRFRFW